MTNAGVAPGRGERGVRRTADRFVPRSRKNPFSNVPRGARAWTITPYVVPRGDGDGAGGGGAAGAALLRRPRVSRTVVGVGLGEARHQGGCRRVAGKGVSQMEFFERWQSAAVERSGEDGAAAVGDLGVVEV